MVLTGVVLGALAQAQVQTTPTPVFNGSCTAVSPTPFPVAAPPAGATVFHVNPDSIRVQLLQNNTSLDVAFKQVEDAKDQVTSKALSLLPSVSLSLKGSFVVSQIQFLLPFLFPSNWFNTFEQADLYQAQLQAYKILELNTYGSALSVYYTIMSDAQTAQVYQQEANDLQNLANALELEYQMGVGITKISVDQAEGNAKVAAGNANGAVQTMINEMESLKAMLALPPGPATFLVLDPGDMPASAAEGQNIQTAINQALSIAPELSQIKQMEKAANAAKWSNVFSFLGSASLSSQSTTGSAGLGSLSAVGQTTLGASIFPTISLSNRNIQEVKEQETELNQETGQVISTSIQNVDLAKSQFNLDSDAVNELTQAYNGVSCEYAFGLANMVDVLTARANMTSAELSQIAARLDLSLLRITLHRAFLTDEFANIHGCSQPNVATGWFHKKQTLTQVCHEDGPAQNKPVTTP